MKAKLSKLKRNEPQRKLLSRMGKLYTTANIYLKAIT